MKTTLFALSLLLSARAFAGSSASANYTTTTEALDAGGRAATSASYANDSSIGAIGGIVTLSSYTSRAGFPGQLYDTGNSLEVTAPFSYISESVGTQLTVRRICTDTTLLTLAPTAVTWSSAGPLSITTAGIASGNAVYQDTAATAIATLGAASGNLALNVVDSSPDNYGSYAGDGLPDSWQFSNFGLNNTNAAPTVDADKDGQDNRLEYLATTLPLDASSRLRFRIELVPGNPSWRRLVFSPYSSNRTYSLYSTLNLTDPMGWQPRTAGAEGLDGAEYFFIDVVGAEARRFYRVKISD